MSQSLSLSYREGSYQGVSAMHAYGSPERLLCRCRMYALSTAVVLQFSHASTKPSKSAHPSVACRLHWRCCTVANQREDTTRLLRYRHLRNICSSSTAASSHSEKKNMCQESHKTKQSSPLVLKKIALFDNKCPQCVASCIKLYSVFQFLAFLRKFILFYLFVATDTDTTKIA